MKHSEELKEKIIQLYLEGKNYKEIEKELDCSRNYIGKLIREKNIDNQRKKILKVTKNQKKKFLNIGINMLNKIGIQNDIDKNEYVEISIDTENKALIIKKHHK